MSKQKVDGLLIGRGDLTSNARTSFIFASSYQLGPWFNNLAYPIEAVAEYSGKYWRVIAAGLGSGPNPTPDTDPTHWEIHHPQIKDGDIAAIVPGTSPNPASDTMIRNNGVWTSLIGLPILIVLADNTLGQTFLSIPLALASGATFEVTIDRFPNKRRMNLRYVSDGTVGPTGASISEYNDQDIGAGDVGVTFNAQVNGGGTAVDILADTDSQPAIPILVKYTFKGWV